MQWSLPTHNEDGTWTPGEWMPEIDGPLVECENGYHLATLEQLPRWLDERIFVAEVDGEIIESTDHDKWVARKVRLISETAWDERKARLFACDCAEQVLPLYEQDYPGDMRPRQAIETARRYANGEAAVQELNAARAAARAAWAAARVATRAATAAAWAAAEGAAVAAAWNAVRDTTGYAARSECKWQSLRLAEYLEVAPDADS
jgi:hypothetical protein